MTGWSEEEILADLLEAAKPPPKPELKSAEQKLVDQI